MRHLAAIALLCPALGACSIYLPISPLAQNDDITGSIGAPATAKPASPLSPRLTEEDWRRAQAALILAVDPQGNGAPVTWDNPETGAKGTFVASGALYLYENRICRPFAATLNKPEPDTQISGNSCRLGPNDWFVRDVQASAAN